MTEPPPPLHLHEARDAGRSPHLQKLPLYYIKYNVPLPLSSSSQSIAIIAIIVIMVNTGRKTIVNLLKKTCGCGDFQEYQSPCAHAIVAAR
jgi:hypothetical protein